MTLGSLWVEGRGVEEASALPILTPELGWTLPGASVWLQCTAHPPPLSFFQGHGPHIT